MVLCYYSEVLKNEVLSCLRKNLYFEYNLSLNRHSLKHIHIHHTHTHTNLSFVYLFSLNFGSVILFIFFVIDVISLLFFSKSRETKKEKKFRIFFKFSFPLVWCERWGKTSVHWFFGHFSQKRKKNNKRLSHFPLASQKYRLSGRFQLQMPVDFENTKSVNNGHYFEVPII